MLTDKEKREAIEKALRVRTLRAEPGVMFDNISWIDLDALAKEAIVIECKVEHDNHFRDYKYQDRTLIWGILGGEYQCLRLPGHHGKPGKAIVIIIPEEEK